MDAYDELAALLVSCGEETYGEAVTKRDHLLLTARAAEQDGADDDLVLAGLLHDVGHLIGPSDDWSGTFDHARIGAEWVEARFGSRVAAPVRLHVEAKRYLCAVDAGYHARLSPASQHTLAHQGGAMDAEERAGFEAHPGWERAVTLRRLEDSLGKRAVEYVPGLDAYRDRLRVAAGG